MLTAQAAKVNAETDAIIAGEDGENPARLAAEIALMGAQTTLAGSTSAHVDGQESREAAAAAAAAQDRIDEAARLADLREDALGAPWGSWADEE